jgi:hypothetical protein
MGSKDSILRQQVFVLPQKLLIHHPRSRMLTGAPLGGSSCKRTIILSSPSERSSFLTVRLSFGAHNALRADTSVKTCW